MGIFPIRITSPTDFKNHLRNMKKSTSPLVGNAIEVHLGFNDDIFEYIFQGNQWFQQFGKYVFYMKFKLLVSSHNILVLYASMRDWIQECQNLRSFGIMGSFSETSQCSERILRTLGVQIEMFTLEFGPSIETLLYDFQGLPEVMSNEIYRAMERSVKKLYFRLDQWSKRTAIMFTQVTDLEIDNVISIVVLNDFLRSCIPLKASLSKLKLNLHVTVDWTDILIILRALCVHSLELQDDSSKKFHIPCLTNFSRARLKVETLTQLSVFDSFGLTFDFLINFPCLKFLQVKAVFQTDKAFKKFSKSPGKTQLDITIRDALYRNIKPNFHLWLTLPSLKMFVVRNLVEEKMQVITYVRDVSVKRRTVVYVLGS